MADDERSRVGLPDGAGTRGVTLVLRAGNHLHRHPVDRTPFTIGRSPDSDLIVPHPYISREHARVVEEPDGFWIEDAGSRHGLLHNGNPVRRSELRPGDSVHLGGPGGVSLTVEARAGAAPEDLRRILAAVDGDSELKKLNWMVEAARRLYSTGGVADILSALIETALTLTGFERGYVFFCHENDLVFAAARNRDGETLSDAATLSYSAIHRAMDTVEPYIRTDALQSALEHPAESVIANNIRTIVAMPLRRRREGTSSEVLGVLYLDSRLIPGQLSETDHGLLQTVAAEAATLVENAELARAEEASRAVREELAFAAGIQQKLMSVSLPELDYARVDARNLPCREVGGDFFDVLHDERGLAVIIADVSGKGTSAAILASTLQGMVYSQLLVSTPLPTIAATVNHYLCVKKTGKYATMVVLRVDRTGRVEYINCGHESPIWIRQGMDRAEELTEGSIPVGLFPIVEFRSEELRLKNGDVLVLASDGITESENPDGEFFGRARLVAAAERTRGDLNGVLAEVESFCGATPATDDRTLVCLQYLLPPAAVPAYPAEFLPPGLR